MDYIWLAKFLALSIWPVLMMGIVFFIYKKNTKKKEEAQHKNNLLDK